jgi:hypothetical protein
VRNATVVVVHMLLWRAPPAEARAGVARTVVGDPSVEFDVDSSRRRCGWSRWARGRA